MTDIEAGLLCIGAFIIGWTLAKIVNFLTNKERTK